MQVTRCMRSPNWHVPLVTFVCFQRGLPSKCQYGARLCCLRAFLSRGAGCGVMRIPSCWSSCTLVGRHRVFLIIFGTLALNLSIFFWGYSYEKDLQHLFTVVDSVDWNVVAVKNICQSKVWRLISSRSQECLEMDANSSRKILNLVWKLSRNSSQIVKQDI